MPKAAQTMIPKMKERARAPKPARRARRGGRNEARAKRERARRVYGSMRYLERADTTPIARGADLKVGDYEGI